MVDDIIIRTGTRTYCTFRFLPCSTLIVHVGLLAFIVRFGGDKVKGNFFLMWSIPLVPMIFFMCQMLHTKKSYSNSIIICSRFDLGLCIHIGKCIATKYYIHPSSQIMNMPNCIVKNVDTVDTHTVGISVQWSSIIDKKHFAHYIVINILCLASGSKLQPSGSPFCFNIF